MRFADFKTYEEGKDGYYVAVSNELGCKVLKRGTLLNAQIEFLFNLYVQNHPATRGLTSEVLACGMVPVEFKGQTKPRPVIWMKHIEGANCYQHALDLGWEINPGADESHALTLGYECEKYAPVIGQMTQVHRALKETGYSAWDHEMAHNYLYAASGLVRAIDFKPLRLNGKVKEDHTLLKTIYDQYGDALTQTLPEQYLVDIIALGLMD